MKVYITECWDNNVDFVVIILPSEFCLPHPDTPTVSILCRGGALLPKIKKLAINREYIKLYMVHKQTP